jgi:hypothetical protein
MQKKFKYAYVAALLGIGTITKAHSTAHTSRPSDDLEFAVCLVYCCDAGRRSWREPIY